MGVWGLGPLRFVAVAEWETASSRCTVVNLRDVAALLRALRHARACARGLVCVTLQ